VEVSDGLLSEVLPDAEGLWRPVMDCSVKSFLTLKDCVASDGLLSEVLPDAEGL
jgi:hypothetical protein